MSAPQVVLDLVARFEQHRESYTSGNYNETQLRREFLDPFFKALGWDVDNEQGYAEAYKDVIHEDAIRIGGAVKAPDYCFRIGGTRKFFLEAKKPSVSIKDETSPAYQLRRYAWSAKLPLSILSDFHELAVFDCRIRPDKNDKASAARIFYCTHVEYAEKWEWIAAHFSRDAVLKGAFDKYAESSRTKKGTAEVDAAFLGEIEKWRQALAANLALRNAGLTQRELNFAVQRIIDRIIFLRICEDRSIENYAHLMSLTNGPGIYRRLCQLFHAADDRYNSGLFHFKNEKNRHEAPDELTTSLLIDDKLLREMLLGLYYPDSPYEFSVLPADILGQVYEQFLGKVIRLTPGHRAVIEDKPEVKKAGGVYYTPTYIVDYIVRQTVGKLVEGKTPKQVADLRVLDPACGSGSFLIGAYQFLLDWHRDWYEKNDPEKWAKGRRPALVQASGGSWKLAIDERKRILLNSIYGVDIDAQAGEVTKLSLLLKVLEGETEQTLQPLRLFRERALPDLGNNIKCGNSLIGPDFHEQMPLLNEEERLRVNIFDWQAEFPEVFKSGGFDAVIGNPPYVRQESLGNDKEYFQKHFDVYHGIADLYAYFIEQGVTLLRAGGLFGYIVANKWMRANYGEPLRRWLKQQDIVEIVDFGDLPVFKTATTYPCILVISKMNIGAPAALKGLRRKAAPATNITQVRTLAFDSLEHYVRENHYVLNQSTLDDSGWSLADSQTQKLLDKLKTIGTPLGEYVQGKIHYGIKTGLNEAFVIDAETRQRLIRKDAKCAAIIKPFLAGRDIKRYQPLPTQQFLICMPRGWTRKNSSHPFLEVTPPPSAPPLKVRGGWGSYDSMTEKHAWNCLKENYPAIANHLQPFSTKAQKRYDKGEYWWELRTCDYYDEFEKPKIIIPAIVRNASYAFDREGFYSNDKTTIIPLDDLYLVGILNSKVPDFVMHSISSTKQGGYFEYKPMYVQQLPIRPIDFSNKADKALHDTMVKLVGTMLELNKQLPAARTPQEKTSLERRIAAKDRQIDQLVYELYGLTPEEIAIVESSVTTREKHT
ncbi:MAG TPA: TaqI-like C-terminal specificity domain-containing protein [Dissulfurispiraceae bacterium]|nr:TaqI-like C-terminal specificity domain-containing protein [Dissulfurispiraceae bacterium]